MALLGLVSDGVDVAVGLAVCGVGGGEAVVGGGGDGEK